MRPEEQLKKKLDYARFVHLAVIYMIAMFVYLFTTLPEKRWVLLTILVISAGIEPGLIIKRSIHRVGGTFAALLILIPLIYLMQLNYRCVSVLFIVVLIGLNVTSFNTSRYNISVFFMTLSVFLLLAQTTESTSPLGPFEMMVNRGVCTVIGAVIVLTADYFLFQQYRYSYKLYLFHQMMVYRFLHEALQRITRCRESQSNNFLFIERMRDHIIQYFAPILVSSDNLSLEHHVSAEDKERIVLFQNTIWELRRLLFALCMSELVLKSPEVTEKHRQQFQRLMHIAKDNFITTMRV